jgi:hypothetical protein
MKRITSTSFWAILMLEAVSLSSCETSSIEQLNKIKKPAIVYSKHKEQAWYESSSMVIKDADGKLIILNKDAELQSLIDKYNVGDTLQ